MLLTNSGNFSWDGRWENEKCRQRYPNIKSKFCSLYAVASPTVALLGDSHAMAFYYGLATVLGERGENLVNIGGASCMPAIDAPFHSTGLTLKKDNLCKQTINEAMEMTAATPSVSTIALAGRRFIRELSPSERDAVGRALRKTFERLTAAGKKIVYVLDFPEPNLEPEACVRTWPGLAAKANCIIDADTARTHRQSQEDLVRSVARDYPSVSIFDPFDYLCSGKKCPVVGDQRSLYIDRDHLSRDGSALVAPGLAAAILK
jgi:hypothetical protein